MPRHSGRRGSTHTQTHTASDVGQAREGGLPFITKVITPFFFGPVPKLDYSTARRLSVPKIAYLERPNGELHIYPKTCHFVLQSKSLWSTDLEIVLSGGCGISCGKCGRSGGRRCDIPVPPHDHNSLASLSVTVRCPSFHVHLIVANNARVPLAMTGHFETTSKAESSRTPITNTATERRYMRAARAHATPPQDFLQIQTSAR